MTLEKFKSYMTKLQNMWDTEMKINSIIAEANKTMNLEIEYVQLNRFCDDVVELLECEFNDKDDWIGYWVFECDFGRCLKPNSVTDEDGNPIDITTIEKLYDFLRGNHHVNKNE